MFRISSGKVPSLLGPSFIGRSLVFSRTARNQAFDAEFDQDELADARKWYSSFSEGDLPKGQTSYARSSGPGGQHVNKTETKAVTVWPVQELTRMFPKLMHSALRSSRYYTKGNDSLTIQAQTQRSRTANTDENFSKLAAEVHRIYREAVPGMTSIKKIKKYEALEKAFHENRVKAKKQQSAKKSSRKASLD